MKNNYKNILILLFLTATPLLLFSQETITKRPYIYFPGAIPEYNLNTSIGLTIARLPRPIVEEELDQAPMLDFHFRFGLPYNFSLFSRISTIGITNNISAGACWSFSVNKISFSIGNSLACWLGWANFYDFDVRAYGINNYPEISVGYDFKNILLTLRMAADYQFSMYQYSGNVQTKVNKSRMLGFSSGLFVEQIFWRKNWITLGLKMRYSRFFYQSWISFSTLDQWFWTPEILLSYNL